MMGHTSNEAKQRWNDSHYTQLKVSVSPELAAAFKAKCIGEGVSMASEITRFMTAKTSGVNRPLAPSSLPYETRQKRRKAVSKMILELENIIASEQGYLDRIPANLQASSLYDAAVETVDVLTDALGMLSEAYQ
jgi:hypothetical protein